MKKENKKTQFEIFVNMLEDSDKELIIDYFKEFNNHCTLGNSDKKKMRKDFEKAILYYNDHNISIKKSLELLNVEYMGGFYAREAKLWFPLDDAAKIYPIAMGHGKMSMFRISMNLKQEVVPELLQIALTFTIKRFPSFATTLKKGVFWHYLDSTKRCFNIEEENDAPCQPLAVSRSGSQSFRVLYFKNRISIEFFHVLTDAVGGMAFLKALVAEYIRLTNVVIEDHTGIMDINESPSYEECANDFDKIKKNKASTTLIHKPAVQMNGKLTSTKPCRIITFKMNVNKLKEVAKKYNTTITGYMLALMFLACRASTDQFDGDFSIQVPVNMRKFYDTKTLRNFSMYCAIRIPIREVTDVESLVKEICKQLCEKANVEEMSHLLYSSRKLVRSIRFIPLIIKQPIVKPLYGLLGDNVFTTTLSNIGIVDMPKEYNDYIESCDFILGTSIINRASCDMATFNDIATFSITKMTVDPAFEEKMHNLLVNDGIDVTVEGSDQYEG